MKWSIMKNSAKLDLRKELKHLYAPSAKTIAVVNVPTYQYAMVDDALQPGQKPRPHPDFRTLCKHSTAFLLR